MYILAAPFGGFSDLFLQFILFYLVLVGGVVWLLLYLKKKSNK